MIYPFGIAAILRPGVENKYKFIKIKGVINNDAQENFDSDFH